MRSAQWWAGVLVAAGCTQGVDGRIADSQPGDVSFLVPLRSVADFGAATQGGHGTLLPQSQFDLLEPLTPTDKPEDLYANLDVVGVRLDPCFFEGSGEPTCSPQVRLVLQPVIDETSGPIARDATVHLFYAVPLAEVRELASQLVEVRLAAGGTGALGPHVDPVSAAAEVLPYVGADRLIRATFVAVHASNQAWTFGGFDFVGDEAVEMLPPGVDEHEQHLTSTGGTTTLDATILPAPVIEPAIADYMEEFLRDAISDDAEQAAFEALERLLDPASHNPGTVDCASCHMATPAMHFAADERGLTPLPEAYANSQNQRMFGYFDTAPSVSPRVAAETEQVLATLKSGS